MTAKILSLTREFKTPVSEDSVEKDDESLIAVGSQLSTSLHKPENSMHGLCSGVFFKKNRDV